MPSIGRDWPRAPWAEAYRAKDLKLDREVALSFFYNQYGTWQR